MKLPNDCLFSGISLAQSCETETDHPDCCRAGASVDLIATDEPPLCRARQTEREAYRFIWQDSFNGDALVHIASTGDTIRLRSTRFYSPLRQRVLSNSLLLVPDDWETLQCALKTCNFWALDTTEERFGLDGAWWLIEGCRADVYHSVSRWCPRGAFRDLGRLFFALAGTPLAGLNL